jgi:hypothetical protein
MCRIISFVIYRQYIIIRQNIKRGGLQFTIQICFTQFRWFIIHKLFVSLTKNITTFYSTTHTVSDRNLVSLRNKLIILCSEKIHAYIVLRNITSQTHCLFVLKL